MLKCIINKLQCLFHFKTVNVVSHIKDFIVIQQHGIIGSQMVKILKLCFNLCLIYGNVNIWLVNVKLVVKKILLIFNLCLCFNHQNADISFVHLMLHLEFICMIVTTIKKLEDIVTEIYGNRKKELLMVHGNLGLSLLFNHQTKFRSLITVET